MNLQLPINPQTLPGFQNFVGINPFAPDHQGYDFGAYIKRDGTFVLGLPPGTPVYPIKEGIVAEVSNGSRPEDRIVFHENIKVWHPGFGMSLYHHIDPNHLLEKGTPVTKKTLLGRLTGENKRKTKIFGGHKKVVSVHSHLHFELWLHQRGLTNPITVLGLDNMPFLPSTILALELPGYEMVHLRHRDALPFLDAGLLTFVLGMPEVYQLKP